ncbi:hypothetical protein BGX23_001332, partial [Mortierella sp. AD031]
MKIRNIALVIATTATTTPFAGKYQATDAQSCDETERALFKYQKTITKDIDYLQDDIKVTLNAKVTPEQLNDIQEKSLEVDLRLGDVGDRGRLTVEQAVAIEKAISDLYNAANELYETSKTTISYNFRKHGEEWLVIAREFCR